MKIVSGCFGLAVILTIAGSGSALAKAHDQGVADGSRVDPSSLRGGAVAELVQDGVQGRIASEFKAGNRVVPVVNDRGPKNGPEVPGK